MDIYSLDIEARLKDSKTEIRKSGDNGKTRYEMIFPLRNGDNQYFIVEQKKTIFCGMKRNKYIAGGHVMTDNMSKVKENHRLKVPYQQLFDILAAEYCTRQENNPSNN